MAENSSVYPIGVCHTRSAEIDFQALQLSGWDDCSIVVPDQYTTNNLKIKQEDIIFIQGEVVDVKDEDGDAAKWKDPDVKQEPLDVKAEDVDVKDEFHVKKESIDADDGFSESEYLKEVNLGSCWGKSDPLAFDGGLHKFGEMHSELLQCDPKKEQVTTTNTVSCSSSTVDVKPSVKSPLNEGVDTVLPSVSQQLDNKAGFLPAIKKEPLDDDDDDDSSCTGAMKRSGSDCAGHDLMLTSRSSGLSPMKFGHTHSQQELDDHITMAGCFHGPTHCKELDDLFGMDDFDDLGSSWLTSASRFITGTGPGCEEMEVCTSILGTQPIEPVTDQDEYLTRVLGRLLSPKLVSAFTKEAIGGKIDGVRELWRDPDFLDQVEACGLMMRSIARRCRAALRVTNATLSDVASPPNTPVEKVAGRGACVHPLHVKPSQPSTPHRSRSHSSKPSPESSHSAQPLPDSSQMSQSSPDSSRLSQSSPNDCASAASEPLKKKRRKTWKRPWTARYVRTVADVPEGYLDLMPPNATDAMIKVVSQQTARWGRETSIADYHRNRRELARVAQRWAESDSHSNDAPSADDASNGALLTVHHTEEVAAMPAGEAAGRTESGSKAFRLACERWEHDYPIK